jgi:ELWxxDGT repeat protein
MVGINPGAPAPSTPVPPVGERQRSGFFAAFTSNGGTELEGDGNAAGTVMVKDMRPVNPANPSNLINVGGTLFFTAFSAGFGTELWKSDGTAAGTVMVKDVNPGSGFSNPANLTNVDGTLFLPRTVRLASNCGKATAQAPAPSW